MSNDQTKQAEKPYNPWRDFIENVIDGSNYFRASEYRELIEYIDGLLAAPAAPIGNYQIKRGAGFDSEAFMSVEHMPSGCGQDFFERTDMFMFKFLESIATTTAPGKEPA